jgi:hypothetical protein
MSVIAFWCPGMSSIVMGPVCASLSRRVRAQMSHATVSEPLDASRVTQLTDGELSVNRVMCFSFRAGATCSITSHRMRRLAISRSEFNIVPHQLSSVLSYDFTVSGHSRLKTVAMQDECFPTITHAPNAMSGGIANSKVVGMLFYQFSALFWLCGGFL